MCPSTAGRDELVDGENLIPRKVPFREFGQAAAIALISIGILFENIESSSVPLVAMEYREDCRGERYSMASWRYWDDFAGAVNLYLKQSGPVRFRSSERTAPEVYRELAWQRTAEDRIQRFEFWRTLPRRMFARDAVDWTPAPTEDVGRSRLAARGFQLLSGVSPYLLIWLGPLFAIPLLAWLCWALCVWARQPVAGAVTALLVAFSSFAAEIISLPRSAVGFHFLGVLLLAALAVTLLAGPAVPRRSALGFVGVAGVLFSIFTIARSGTGLVAPGFVVLFLLYEMRFAAPRKAVFLRGLAWTAIFLLPYLVARPPEYHNIWTSVWEGLADFGEDRGFSWHDRDAKRVLEAAGIKPFEDPKEVSEVHEAFFRTEVLRTIKENPFWYATVLVRRGVRTVSFSQLAPSCSEDGQAVVDPTTHYKYTTSAEHFGIGRRRHEFPFWVLPLPIVLWATLAVKGLSRRSSFWQAQAGVGLVLLAGVLAPPVLISTLAGQEAQMAAVLAFYSAGQLASLVRARIHWP